MFDLALAVPMYWLHHDSGTVSALALMGPLVWIDSGSGSSLVLALSAPLFLEFHTT